MRKIRDLRSWTSLRHVTELSVVYDITWQEKLSAETEMAGASSPLLI